MNPKPQLEMEQEALFIPNPFSFLAVRGHPSAPFGEGRFLPPLTLPGLTEKLST